MNCLFLLPKNFNWKYKVNQKFSSCECLRNNLSAWSFSCIICKANTKILVIPNIERNWEDHVDISIVSREPVSVLCCNNRSSLLMMPHEINLYSDSCCITQNSFCLRCFFFPSPSLPPLSSDPYRCPIMVWDVIILPLGADFLAYLSNATLAQEQRAGGSSIIRHNYSTNPVPHGSFQVSFLPYLYVVFEVVFVVLLCFGFAWYY